MTEPTSESLPDERPQRKREYSGAGSTLGVAALVILAVGLGIWYFEVRGGSSEGTSTPGLGIVDHPPDLKPDRPPAAELGRVAPNFRLAGLDGQPLTLSDYRGQRVLLNFWASWCGPCRGETPDLQAFSGRMSGRGWVVIGVNQQESPDTARAFTEEFGVTYPVVLDQTGEVSQAYRVGRGLPVTFALDRNGVVERVIIGRVPPDELAKLEDGLSR